MRQPKMQCPRSLPPTSLEQVDHICLLRRRGRQHRVAKLTAVYFTSASSFADLYHGWFGSGGGRVRGSGQTHIALPEWIGGENSSAFSGPGEFACGGTTN